MWILIIILIILAIGIFLGYRIGVYFVRRENDTLHKQLDLLENFNEYWASNAAGKEQLSQKIAEQQTNNTATTMQTVIQLLRSIQHQQVNTTNQEEKQKLDNIINQVKHFTL